MESKIIKTSLLDEKGVIKEYTKFGWILKSIKEVSFSTEEVPEYENYYKEYNKVPYLLITFVRNENKKNIDEIKSNEENYFNNMRLYHKNRTSIIPVIYVLVIILGLIIAGIGNIFLYNKVKAGLIYIGVGFFIWILWAFAIYFPRKSKQKKYYNAAMNYFK